MYLRIFARRNKSINSVERLKLIQDKFELKPTLVTVSALHNRRASKTPKNRLIFHSKCAMASFSVFDYIITHEMAHLKFPNHSPQSWNELDKKMPNYKENEIWLKLNAVKKSVLKKRFPYRWLCVFKFYE